MSDTIEMTPYSSCWPEEFKEIATRPGRFNQRYALLCRDYLRSHPHAAQLLT